MSNRFGAWLVVGMGWSALIAGCSGTAQDSAPGAPDDATHATGGENSGVLPAQGAEETASAGAGSGNSAAVPAVRGSEAGAGGAGEGAESGSGEAGSGPAVCTGELSKVAALWWLECPSTYCAALAWAQGCQSLPSRPIVRAGNCQDLKVVTLDYGTHSKECYYSFGTNNSSELVGAAASDDTLSYCAQSSYRIEAGTTASCNPATVCNDAGEMPESNDSGC
ncbi:MAG TPA: hypothetical protein VER96_20920 [Polyangiaceae bacterium]|nr:hypothetical protein [Polyangiaceae bacterium]